MNELLFIETSAFTKWVRKNRLGAAVEKLKAELRQNPAAGDVIPGGSGVRKVRVAGGGRGKRGGFRVVYVLVADLAVAGFLKGYAKNEQGNPDADELRAIVGMLPVVEAAARETLKRLEPPAEGENGEE